MGFASYLQKLTDNDEWYTPVTAVNVVMPYIPRHYTIWCPFDKHFSQYVQVFKRGGIK